MQKAGGVRVIRIASHVLLAVVSVFLFFFSITVAILMLLVFLSGLSFSGIFFFMFLAYQFFAALFAVCILATPREAKTCVWVGVGGLVFAIVITHGLFFYDLLAARLLILPFVLYTLSTFVLCATESKV